ncbi:MAG TPA: type I secretion system permease/ATPase [Sulfurimonas sp.]|nr:type I secretion system permease/ATPase [Sulfurimonas sp.]
MPDSINPLLECLVILTKLYNRPFTAEALIAGLPIEDGRTTPELFSIHHSKANFSRAAKHAGFASELVKRDLDSISTMVLPCILTLKNKQACILKEIDVENSSFKIILPEISQGEEWITKEKLEEQYLGFAFFLKPQRHTNLKTKPMHIDMQGHWFWGTLKKSTSIYRDVMIASILINLFVLATPLFTMNVYDRVVPNGAIETMWVLAIGILSVHFFDMALKLIRSYFLENAGKKSDVIMSSILFSKVMNLKMEVKPKSVGSFANNLKEFDSIRNFITSSSVSALIDLPFILLFLVVTYYIAGIVVMAPIFIILLIILYSFIVKGPLQRSIESTYEAASHKNSVLIETLSNLETIKTMGATGHAQYKWEEATGEIAYKSLKSKILSASITTITGFLIQVNTIIVLIIGVYLIADNALSMGGLIAAVILTSRAIAPLAQVAALLSNYEQTKTAYNSLNDIINMPVERPLNKSYVQHSDIKGKIEFKDVCFTYPNHETEILKNISFVIHPGEHMAIIGRVGSGKTSIEKLLMGLYQPTSGSILIDDIDINQIDPANLRKNISYVPQEISLLRGTLRDNIVYKMPHASDEEILAAAAIGTVDLFVNTHPKGFDMEIDEQGASLSGGQKQSVAIARAFIHPTPIIILDEPSNAMDSTTEALLIQRLSKKITGSTTLTVTHKTSLLALCDRIILLDNGKILQDGKKKDVIKALSKGGNS